jgi:molybdopterin-guanine dinucleotide biosynthesis protein A
MKIPAIILAGGECGEELHEITHEREKAFVKVGGRPLVEHMVQALTGAEGVGPITFVGNADRLRALFPQLTGAMFLPGEKSLFDNVMKGLRSVTAAGRALICACDTPLVTSSMVTWFIEACADPAIDFYYPVSEMALVKKRFPDMKRTYVRLSDGTFTGGNMMLLNPQSMVRCEEGIREAIAQRKNPLRLAGRMGFGFLLRLFCRRVSVHEAEKVVEHLLGIRVKAVITPFPEMGCDLDKAGDYRVFEWLSK